MKNQIPALGALVLSYLLLGTASSFASPVFYVDQRAPAGGNGASWPTAFRSLEDGLNAAVAYGHVGVEIRVAQGVYRPITPITPDSPLTTFHLPNGVTLRGGFAGIGADPDERDPSLYASILSGDASGNDGPGFAHYEDNSGFIVTAESLNAPCVIDGFVFNHAKGGLSNSGCRLTLVNCRFEELSLRELGSRAYPAILNNTAELTLVDCRISDCGDWDAYPGTVLYSLGDSHLRIDRCVFANNASGQCPGLGNYLGSFASVTNTVFVNNYGYSAAVENGATLVMANCAVIENTARRISGAPPYPSGLSNRGTAEVHNSILYGNRNENGETEYAQLGNLSHFDGVIDVSHSCIQNWSGSLGGQNNIGELPQFIDLDGADDVLGSPDDDYRLRSGSPCIDAGDNTIDIDALMPVVQSLPAKDLNGRPRIVDDPDAPDVGTGTPPIVDMGPLEGATSFIVVADPTLMVPEGGQVAFDVRLSNPPAAPIVVHAALVGPAPLSIVSGAEMTFDAMNFAESQQVVVSSSPDLSYMDDRATIRLSSNAHPIQDVAAIQIDATAAPSVLHVRSGANPPGDGSTWENAMNSIQQAMDVAAVHPEVAQIWVAEGVYTPSRRRIAASARSVTFLLTGNVVLIGGFAGTETSIDERDIAAHESTLSGDLMQDDHGSPTDPSRGENAFNVVTFADGTEIARLDGFTITGGLADKPDSQYVNNAGAGIQVISGKALIENCLIRDNRAKVGAGLALAGQPFLAVVRVNHSVLRDNVAEYRGGAVYSYGELTLDDCDVRDNDIDGSYGNGGAIYNYGPMLRLLDSDFIQNGRSSPTSTYSFYGGAIQTYGPIEAEGCRFVGNVANVAGAILVSGDFPASFLDCDFIENEAEEEVAALYLSGIGDAWIDHCHFEGNRTRDNSSSRAAVVQASFGTLMMSDCVFRAHSPVGVVPSSGVMNVDALGVLPALIQNCLFEQNRGGKVGIGNFRNCIVEECTFINNVGSWAGTIYADNTQVINSRFLGNRSSTSTSSNNGNGAIVLGDYSCLLGCLFSGNTGARAGAITSSGRLASITNCTLFGNSSDTGPAGIRVSANSTSIRNTISRHAASDYSGTADIQYSCLRLEPGDVGEGVIDVDPQFIDADGSDDVFGTIDDDPSIATMSLCANAGKNFAGPFPATDLLGNARIAACRIDMGAFETTAFVLNDCNQNARHDDCEILDGDLEDCNQNMLPDACEIADEPAIDLNLNGVPDDCEMRLLRVDSHAPDGGDGASWETAFNSLQAALGMARDHDGPVEIWVAAGTYLPESPNDLTIGFHVPDDVALYGGFAGGETDRAQRDFAQNVTILSGDYGQNDEPADPCCDGDPSTECENDVCRNRICMIRPDCCEGDWDHICDLLAESLGTQYCPDCVPHEDNSHIVVDLSDTTSATILDGFSVRGGAAPYSSFANGGGIFVAEGAPIIRNCLITDNYVAAVGVRHSQIDFSNCRIINTRAVRGRSAVGILIDEASNVVLSNCLIDNHAGTGLLCRAAESVHLENCRISRCTTGIEQWWTPVTAVNCVITQNGEMDIHAAGVYLWGQAVMELLNCTVAHNEGRGVVVENGSMLVARNSIFWRNSFFGQQTEMDQIDGNFDVASAPSEYDIRYCCILGLDRYAGPGNIGADPRFVDPTARDLRLTPVSSCGDAGDNAALPVSLVSDIEGVARVIACAVDMGAHEIPTGAAGSADFDGDGAVTLADLDQFVALLLSPSPLGQCVGDLNQDGSMNGDDVAEFSERILN